MGRMPVDLGELVEHWTLLDDEQELVISKRGATKLGFALLLKFCTLKRATSRFGAWTGIIPIIKELPVRPGPAESDQHPNRSHARPCQGPRVRGTNANYAATRYSWTRPPSRSARWAPSSLVNFRKVE